MPKPSKNTRRYKKRRSTKGGCGCNANTQKGGYSIKKLSIVKSIKSKSKKNRRRIIMKGGLGGNSSLAFGTVDGAYVASGALSGAALTSGIDPSIPLSGNVGGNNIHSLPMV